MIDEIGSKLKQIADEQRTPVAHLRLATYERQIGRIREARESYLDALQELREKRPDTGMLTEIYGGLNEVGKFLYRTVEFEPVRYTPEINTLPPLAATFPFTGNLEGSDPLGIHMLGIRERGYQRPPLPAEVMSLHIAAAEGRLEPELQELEQDIAFEPPGEWSDLSITTWFSGTFISCYENPRGYFREQRDNPPLPDNFSRVRSFRGAAIKINETEILETVAEKNPDLVVYLFGMTYESLPEKIRGNGSLHLHQLGANAPVALVGCLIDTTQLYSTSRGVREKHD